MNSFESLMSSMDLKKLFSRFTVLRVKTLQNKCERSALFYCSTTDAYLDYLAVEGSKQDLNLHEYFKNSKKIISMESFTNKVSSSYTKQWSNSSSSENRISHIESEIKKDKSIPNEKLFLLLSYFVKKGDINGVMAIQMIIEKYNNKHFKLYSEYKHYLAEALWINGKIEDSLDLFSYAYCNKLVRPKVTVMLKCLFPLLISNHSEVILYKVIHSIEKMALKTNDHILLAYIWKELFLSEWFSDQQLSKQIIETNHNLLDFIQFMIPIMGKMLLDEHKIESFQRLIEFTLEMKLKQDGALIRLIFDYYCFNQNLERCSAVVKYASNYSDSPLTEDQQRRYIGLLLKSNSCRRTTSVSQVNIRKAQQLKFQF